MATITLSFELTETEVELYDRYADKRNYQKKITDSNGNLIDNPKTKKDFGKKNLEDFLLGRFIQTMNNELMTDLRIQRIESPKLDIK